MSRTRRKFNRESGDVPRHAQTKLVRSGSLDAPRKVRFAPKNKTNQLAESALAGAYWGCTKKTAYDHPAQARKAGQQLMSHQPKKIYWYECPLCDRLHLTSRPGPDANPCAAE